MGQRYMRQKLKSIGSFLLILLLLPYVVTVLIHGVDMEVNSENSGPYIKVREILDNGKEQVTEVPWKEYFIGVLAHEIPGSSEEEFVKAQAILIRTNLYQSLDAALEEGKSAVLEEKYLKKEDLEKYMVQYDYEQYYKKLVQAMEQTQNQVLFYQDTYAFVPFHQASNGMTRSYQEVTGKGDYPYLTVRECPLDKEAEDEMQISVFDYQEVQKRCQPFLVAVDKSEAEKTYAFSDFEIISYDSAGYVQQMRIGETNCTGDQFRDALSLPSSAFNLKDVDGRLRVTTVGKGHGFGMSQWTANKMAKEGKSYEEILQFFFEGTNLTDGGEIFTKVE